MTFSKLFPWGLIIAGVLALVAGLKVLTGNPETSPTDVKYSEVRSNFPAAQWIRITDGGEFMPGVLEDFEEDSATKQKTAKGFYLPYMDQTQANREFAALLLDQNPPKANKLVLIKYNLKDYDARHPRPDAFEFDDQHFRPGAIEGKRMKNDNFPSHVKDYILTELQYPIGQVVVIEYGEKPMQPDQARNICIFGGVGIAVGVIWILCTFFRRSDPDPYGYSDRDYNSGREENGDFL